MAEKGRLAIVEDNPSIRFVYEDIFSSEYELYFIKSLEQFQAGRAGLQEFKPQLVLIDLMLGDGMFHDLLSDESFRQGLDFPFMVVSSLDDRDVLNLCLSSGAVDYFTKPIRANELQVKVENFIQSRESRVGGLHLDIERLLMKAQDKEEVPLTHKEALVLKSFLIATEHKVAKSKIFEDVWGGAKVGKKTLDTHFFNLRRKLRPLGYDLICLQGDLYVLINSGLSASTNRVKKRAG